MKVQKGFDVLFKDRSLCSVWRTGIRKTHGKFCKYNMREKVIMAKAGLQIHGYT